MNERIVGLLGLYTKIEKNKKTSNVLKILAGVCLFFSLCYCGGTKNLETIDKSEAIMTNMVWIVSVIILVVLFIKDSNCVKNNKKIELDIYQLEVEDLRNKKELAEITGEFLSDSTLNQQIDIPNEEVSLPILYYTFLLVINIIIRISLINII